jgi:hypothetical protein
MLREKEKKEKKERRRRRRRGRRSVGTSLLSFLDAPRDIVHMEIYPGIIPVHRPPCRGRWEDPGD